MSKTFFWSHNHGFLQIKTRRVILLAPLRGTVMPESIDARKPTKAQRQPAKPKAKTAATRGRPRKPKPAPAPKPAPKEGRRIGYARVSTTDQTRSLQVDALEVAGCDFILEETAGGTADRPILEDALANIEPGDALVVWRLDRLARSLVQLMEIVGKLDAAGAHFVSLTEALDTTTPGGRLVYHVTGAIAEFERSLLLQRTHAGLEAARSRGRIGGRPAKLTGEQIDAARAMLRTGSTSTQTIAQGFGVSVSTLYRALARQEKAGDAGAA